MIMELQKLQIYQHNKYLLLRSINRIIDSIEFAEVFASSTDQEKKIINQYIETLNKDALEFYLKKRIRATMSLEELPVVILRNKAKDKGIKGYQYKTKAQLLSELSV